MSQALLMDFGEVVTQDNWMCWSVHAQELNGNIRRKAAQLVKHDCIKYIGSDSGRGSSFIVLPLNTEDHWVVDVAGELREFLKVPFSQDYNSTVYHLWREEGSWRCDCQGHTMKLKRQGLFNDGVMCSHTLSLLGAFKLGLFHRKQRSIL